MRVIVVASIVLGAVFVFSGVMKVAAPRQWRAQSAALGVPSFVSACVPFAELVVGALLVAQLARRTIAVVAGSMLLVFTALLVLRISQGRRPPCACFGALSSKPIGWGDVVRNAAFVALAVVMVVRPR